MTSYSLQQSLLDGGVFEFILYSEFTDLVIPTFASLAMPEGTKERADTLPLTYELEQLKLEYTEDYSYYTQEGFWFKVLAGECEIQITCDGEHFFWGMIDTPISDIGEMSLVTNFPERHGSFLLTSVLAKTKKTLTTYVLVDLAPDGGRTIEYDTTNPGNPGGTNALACSMKAILASIISRTFSQDYDIDDVLTGGNIETDFKTIISGNDYYMTDLWVYGGYRYPASTYVRQGYLLQSNNEYSLDYMYYYAYDLMWALCKCMGVFPLHYYDTTTQHHQIRLVSRSTYYGQANTYIVPASPDGSTLMLTAYPPIHIVAGARISSSNRYDERWVRDGAAYSGTVTPAELQTDVSVDHLFVYNDAEETFDSSKGWLWLYRANGTSLDRVTSMYFYKYDGTGWSSDTPASQLYWFYRYGVNKRGYSRLYPTLKTTDSNGITSQKANRILVTTPINDGVAARTFFAAEMFKNPTTNETQVTWIEY
jgi:hypothetical protein